MPYRFTDPSPYKLTRDAIFLGLDPATGCEIGIETDRHVITVAGSRSGKGAAQIIPTLQRWPHAALVIDAKGENCERTYQAREAMGHQVGALDPFGVANIPDRLKVSFNPLGLIDADSNTAREDVLVIADGTVKRSNAKDAMWDDGARSIIAGVMAFVIEDTRTSPEHRTLANVRHVLMQSKDELYADAQLMLDCKSCGGLARSAGITIMSALSADKGTEKEFLAGARRHTDWIDSPAVSAVMSSTSFDLSNLTTGKASLFVILPYRYIETHAAFMRLLVRSSLNTMATAGNNNGNRCLFILDEFYNLGRIDEIAKGAGGMPSYGVHLWPILQDLGQLQELYGATGAQTFFGNADAHIFFGNSDPLTLQYLSERIGKLTNREASDPPPPSPVLMKADPNSFWFGGVSERIKAAHETKMNLYNDSMKMAGQPRLTASEVAEIVGKGKGDKVASSMIVFAKKGDVLNLLLAPYFIKRSQTIPARRPNNDAFSIGDLFRLIPRGFNIPFSFRPSLNISNPFTMPTRPTIPFAVIAAGLMFLVIILYGERWEFAAIMALIAGIVSLKAFKEVF